MRGKRKDPRSWEQKKRDKIERERHYNNHKWYRENISRRDHDEIMEEWQIRRFLYEKISDNTYLWDNYEEWVEYDCVKHPSLYLTDKSVVVEGTPSEELMNTYEEERRRIDKEDPDHKSRKTKKFYGEYYLARLKEEFGKPFDGEILAYLREFGGENFEKRLTPSYVESMAIVYQIFKIRGVTPSPEAEEALKYEILEKQVMNRWGDFLSFANGGECKRNKFPRKAKSDNNLRMLSDLFTDVADAYIGAKQFMDNAHVELKEGKRARMSFAVPGLKNKSKIYRNSYLDSARLWLIFKEENLPELLFQASDPKGLYILFKEELEANGFYRMYRDFYNIYHNIEKEDSFTIEKIKKDPEWESYAFQEHRTYLLGGKNSPGIINPPLMMEALIDRTIRLKKEFANMERGKTQEELDRDETYLHTKWEYLAAKLQVLLMDMGRATAMKDCDETPEEKKNKSIRYIGLSDYWSLQLGKYSDGWLHADYRLALWYAPFPKKLTMEEFAYRPEFNISMSTEQAEYAILQDFLAQQNRWGSESDTGFIKRKIERFQNGEGNPNGEAYEGSQWRISNAAFMRKDEIQREMEAVNKKLTAIGSHAPLYYDGFLFKDPDDQLFNYNAGNDMEKLAFNESIGLKGNAYKKGIVRFDREYLKTQEIAGKALEDDGAAIQEAFKESGLGERVSKQLRELLGKGISAETLRGMIEEMDSNR